MIPDFPDEKQKIMIFWTKYLAAKQKQLLGFMGELPSHMNHEGDRWSLSRPDGTGDESQYKEAKGIFMVEATEVPGLTPEKIREKLDEVAEEMARQAFQGILAEIIKTTNSVGNTVNANGEPMSQDLYLQMLEKMDLSFDKSGKWMPPTMIISPEMLEKNMKKKNLWENDPTFLAKQEEIVARKREEWHDRENCRKLVD